MEPYKIKMIEPLYFPTREERLQAIKEAGYNTFQISSDKIVIDLLTDSGTSAMSDAQWGALMQGDEAYAGSQSFSRLESSVKSILGYPYLIPTHQGRAAEHILAKILVSPGDLIPRNAYFTTSKAHVELCGGRLIDVIIPEAYEIDNEYPFKGNLDIKRLEDLLTEHNDRIPYINVEMNVNMIGGQPISMDNLKAVRFLADEFDKRVIFDATRSSENAYFIKVQERAYRHLSTQEILKKMMFLSDGCIYSAKKDCLVNMGGFIATFDEEIYEKSKELVVVYEGLNTYGGISGRDMDAMAVGLREGIDERYLKFRTEQIQYLASLLEEKGVPFVRPPGGHGIFLDAKRFLPKVPREEWIAQTLTVLIYEDSGIRTMERGSVSKGRDPVTKENLWSDLELVRVTIPRRVYTNSHMEFIADSITRVFLENQDRRHGLKMIHEPDSLRFFQARFEKIER